MTNDRYRGGFRKDPSRVKFRQLDEDIMELRYPSKIERAVSQLSTQFQPSEGGSLADQVAAQRVPKSQQDIIGNTLQFKLYTHQI